MKDIRRARTEATRGSFLEKEPLHRLSVGMAAVFGIVVTITWFPFSLNAQSSFPLFTPFFTRLSPEETKKLDDQARAAIKLSPVRTRTVKAVTHMGINAAAFQQLIIGQPGGTPVFQFNLPGVAPPQTFVVDSVRQEQDGRLIWKLKLPNAPRVTALLIVNPAERSIVGDIRQGAIIYQIRPAQNGAHSIFTIDASLFPSDHAPSPRKPSPDSGNSDELTRSQILARDPVSDSAGKLIRADAAVSLVSNGERQIPELDVMVLYTPESARTFSNGIQNEIESAWQALVDSFNSVGRNGMFVTLRKVSERCLDDFEEAANPDDTVPALQGDQRVTRWRQEDGADLVILWLVRAEGLDCGNTPGLGLNHIPIPLERRSSSFSIVDSACATGNFSFAHELGHQLGLLHDRDTAVAGNDPMYNYGFVNLPSKWKTIMAQDPEGCPLNEHNRPTCRRENWWSDGGRRGRGVANLSDNAQALNQNVKIAAMFQRRTLSTVPVRKACKQ
jgi:Metallo-peptidase family M12